MSWPRGSNIRPVRIQSNSARKCWRRSLMLAPLSCGPPPITTRTGLPQVCASTQLKVNLAIVDPVRADTTARSAVICPNWIQYAIDQRVFSRSLISVSSFSLVVGAGGSAGAAASCLRKRLTCFTRRNTAKATIRKLMQALMKTP